MKLFSKASNAILKASVNVHNMKHNEKGVTAIEYSLIAVAVSAMLYIALGDGVVAGSDNFLGQVLSAFAKITSNLKTTISTIP